MVLHTRLKIALLGVTHPFRGGIAHYTTLLSKALSDRHEVRFFSLKRQYPQFLFPGRTQRDESLATLQVENEPVIDSINPLSWIAAYSRIRQFGPDLVLVSWWHPFFAPAFGSICHMSGKFAGIPSCFICHNVLPHERSFMDRLLVSYGLSSARAIITHSQQDGEIARQLRPSVPVLINPHPRYDFFAQIEKMNRGAAREKLGIRASTKVLLFFGYVREYKGLSVLLKAMGKLPEDYQLLVVGEFYDDREKYEPGLEHLRKQGKLILVDRYVANEEVGFFFGAADLMVAPYLSATQSGVIQVAHGFGMPVVASRVGGIPDVVTEGKTGFLVEPGNSNELAEKISLCFAVGRQEDFGANINAEQQKYSWSSLVDTIERAFFLLEPE